MSKPAHLLLLPFIVFFLAALLILGIDVVFGLGGFSTTGWHLRSTLNTIWFAESAATLITASVMFYFRKNLPLALPWIGAGIAVALLCTFVLTYNALNGRLWPDEYVTHYWEQIYIALHSAIGFNTPFRLPGGRMLMPYQYLFVFYQLWIIVPLTIGYYFVRKRRRY